TGVSVDDLDLVELNEAFAAQSIPVIRELGLDPEKVNVNGGAIALGHPLGVSGPRLVVSLPHEPRRRGGRYGVSTLSVGRGQARPLRARDALRRRRPGAGCALRALAHRRAHVDHALVLDRDERRADADDQALDLPEDGPVAVVGLDGDLELAVRLGLEAVVP